MRGDACAEWRTNAELPDEGRALRDVHVDDDDPMTAVGEIGEIPHPYRRPVYSERRIFWGMPLWRLIGHAEAPDLAWRLRVAHVHQHEDEPHLSRHPSAQVENSTIVEAVAVRAPVAGLEVTQLSRIRRIRDVPDEHALAERGPGLAAPVGRHGLERRRQDVAAERNLKCPRAGRSGDEAKVLRRGRVGDVEDRPAAVPEVTDVEKVPAGLDRQRELEPGSPVEIMMRNSLERSLDSSDPVRGGHRASLPRRSFWMIGRCAGEDGLCVAAVSSVPVMSCGSFACRHQTTASSGSCCSWAIPSV